MARRWIRLDAEWDESEWIDPLSGQAAGCWPRLLCWIKLRGKRGRCKMPARSVLARRWRVARQAVDEMMDAALREGALREENGHLVVSNWDTYQELDRTATDRKRRQRERERSKDADSEDESRVSRRDMGVTRHVTPDRDKASKEKTPTGSKRKVPLPDDWEPTQSHRDRAKKAGFDVEWQAEKFRNHAEATARRQANWNAAFTNWLMNAEEYRQKNGKRPPPEQQFTDRSKSFNARLKRGEIQ